MNYKYDSLDRPVIKYYNNDNPNSAGYHTVYNANGLVGLHKDVVNTQRTRYTYDLAQRLVRVRRNVGCWRTTARSWRSFSPTPMRTTPTD
ncbi:MAG: hypothetical protein ACLU9S_01995 [Oscillospiraceae bacterium]